MYFHFLENTVVVSSRNVIITMGGGWLTICAEFQLGTVKCSLTVYPMISEKLNKKFAQQSQHVVIYTK